MIDFGDKYDSYKWDFPETDLTTVIIEGYPYKVNHDNAHARAKRLHLVRKYINGICNNLLESTNIPTKDNDFGNGLLVFLDTHCELQRVQDDPIYNINLFDNRLGKYRGYSSRYLISEIPKSVKTDLVGINKPKNRYIDPHVKSIGRDGKIRATYRDIFLNENVKGKELKELLLHELAHSGACHFTWVDDNHKHDFKIFENLLKQHAANIPFPL